MRKERVAITTPGGVYLDGSVHGQVMERLVDTGCDVALMPTRVILGIPAQERPKLRACGTVLTPADG